MIEGNLGGNVVEMSAQQTSFTYVPHVCGQLLPMSQRPCKS
jgi:hypothetical protein